MFTFNSDSTFHIGQLHKVHVTPCQDYADSKIIENDGRFILALSDGCSTAGKTDFGSRYWVRRFIANAQKEIQRDVPIVTAQDLELLALEPRDLFATLITVQRYKNFVEAQVFGDGVVVFRYEDGSLLIESFAWNDNTPFYPFYSAELGKSLGLLARFEQFHSKALFPLTRTTVKVSANGQVVTSRYECDMTEALKGISVLIELCTSELQLVSVTIFSDGVHQFVQKENETLSYDYIDLVKQCTDFKSLQGDFLKRRVRKVLANMEKQGYYPYDDFSAVSLLVQRSV